MSTESPAPSPDAAALDAPAPHPSFFEDFSRLNNELVNLQRELIRNNVEVNDSRERYRLLNAELEERVCIRTGELEKARIEADRANGAKSAFLAMMCHELRTPMNGVVGMIDVLHESGLTKGQVEMVDLIRHSALAQLAILEDLMDVAKGEAGTIELQLQPMRLGEAVHAVCAQLEPAATRRGLAIAVFVDPDIPPLLMGDSRRLRQVLFNLLANAIKFSSTGAVDGQVSLRAVLAVPESGAVGIDLIIADRGIGMSEVTVDRLFAPFSQADSSITRPHGGSGVGLAITGMLVRLMGGRLSVESALGEGSTFTVHLHLARAAPVLAASGSGPVPERAGAAFVAASSIPSRDEARRGGRLVLVAEDNEINRKVMVQQMALIGCAIEIAVDGREALEKWRSGEFALLLTDLHMPEMDGYALAAAIRAEEAGGPRKPIIALTANSLHNEESRCLAIGMDAYLTKPVSLPRLKAAIEAGLSGALVGSRPEGIEGEGPWTQRPQTLGAGRQALRAGPGHAATAGCLALRKRADSCAWTGLPRSCDGAHRASRGRPVGIRCVRFRTYRLSAVAYSRSASAASAGAVLQCPATRLKSWQPSTIPRRTNCLPPFRRSNGSVGNRCWNGQTCRWAT